MYPTALQVPGLQRILDHVLQEGVHGLPWWTEWEQMAKHICQTLHPLSRRTYLKQWLPAGNTAVAKSLSLSCDKFADWRWKTLRYFTRDLLRMQDALQMATRTLAPNDLGTKETTGHELFLSSTRPTEFWGRCRAIHSADKVTYRFSSWLRRCTCHDKECKRKRDSSCPWKGCRASELADLVTAFMAE